MSIGRPRAQDVDRHVGARLRALRVAAGLSQNVLADLVGVSCQQLQKNEAGINRLAASRLYALAAVLRCEVGAFFAGLEAPVAECAPEPSDQRRLVDLARHYRRIRVPAHQRLLSGLAAALAGNGAADGVLEGAD